MDADNVAIVNADGYETKTIEDALDKIFSLLSMNPDNPFADIVAPGMTVFIKPNWVASKWRESCKHRGDIYSVITHPAVIEAVADRVAEALCGAGRIIIGDNPSIDADFDELMELTKIDRLKNKYSVPCELIDMRPLVCDDLKYYGKKEKMIEKKGDPRGNTLVDLGEDSMLSEMTPTLFRGVFEERDETVASHMGGKNLYTYGRSLYDADFYISIPKLKTHHKAGVTLNLKGLVGSITNKNQLVHWRVGYPEVGGDEYPDRESWEIGSRAKVTNRGAWPGNDTIWRMVVDLYTGLMRKDRKCFGLIDGIIAGEGVGPFCPTTKKAGVLIAGHDLVVTDVVATRLMGLNPERIKYLNHYLKNGYTSFDSIKIKSFDYPERQFFQNGDKYLNFDTADEWKSIQWRDDIV